MVVTEGRRGTFVRSDALTARLDDGLADAFVAGALAGRLNAARGGPARRAGLDPLSSRTARRPRRDDGPLQG